MTLLRVALLLLAVVCLYQVAVVEAKPRVARDAPAPSAESAGDTITKTIEGWKKQLDEMLNSDTFKDGLQQVKTQLDNFAKSSSEKLQTAASSVQKAVGGS